ncbi:MAG: hypothetical protein LBO78_04025 [Rickettsiales bacterium]|jgi:hypothetical protein|nr:hypothetical protein [Rickettsiales bacterium]
MKTEPDPEPEPDKRNRRKNQRFMPYMQVRKEKGRKVLYAAASILTLLSMRLLGKIRFRFCFGKLLVDISTLSRRQIDVLFKVLPCRGREK